MRACSGSSATNALNLPTAVRCGLSISHCSSIGKRPPLPQTLSGQAVGKPSSYIVVHTSDFLPSLTQNGAMDHSEFLMECGSGCFGLDSIFAAPPPAFTEWVLPHLRGAPSTSKSTSSPTPSTTTIQPAPSTSNATSSPAPSASSIQPAITKSIINRRGLDLNSLAAHANSTIQPNSPSTGEVLVEGANISTVP